MHQQQFEDNDIHICGLCKAKFSNVELFIQHKKFSCPVRLARQRDEFQTQKAAHLLDEEISKSQGNSTLTLSEGQTVGQDGISQSPADIMQVTYSSQDLIKPVAVYVNRGQYPSTIDDYMEMEEECSVRESQPQYTGIEQGQAESASENSICNSQGQEYILISSETGNSQYGSQGHHVEGLKEQGTSQATFSLESNGQQAGNQIPMTTPGIMPGGNENIYLINKGMEPQTSAPHTTQLPVFISREITQSDDNISVQIQDSHVDSAPDIQYTLTFEDSQGQTLSQQVSGASISNITISPKTSCPANAQPQPMNERYVNTMQLKSKPKKDTTADGKKAKRTLEKKYSCHTCNYKFAYLKDLERHSRIHTGEKPFQCEECAKSFNRNDKLLLHMKYHQNDRSFKCELCEYSAVERGSLRKHMKVHLDERPYGCQVCPYKARSASQLQIHLRVHTGDTPYQCKECGASFKVNSDLKRHGRVHTGEKPFACNVPGCNYKCSIKSNLQSHKKTNHRCDIQLSCDVCTYQTSSKKAMFEHKKVHEVNKDLICHICTYQCSNRSALRNHLKTHSGDPFQCNYCSYTSFQSGNVQGHMKRRHTSKIDMGRKSKPEVIPKYKPTTMLENSRVSNRPKLRAKCQQNYKCDECDAAFVREDSLRCHLKQHTDSPLSTAYAVLKLQNPVINTSMPTDGTGAMNNQLITSQAKNQLTIPDSDITNQNLQAVGESTQIIFEQDSDVIQNQTVNLGINDILAAARLSGLASCGNSPNLNKPLEQFIFQEGPDASSTITAITATDNTDDQTITISQQPDQADLSGVQLMQNISLPYMRLPNGQILLLTGQNPTSPILQHSNVVTSEETSSTNHRAAIQTQIIAQQPTSEQEHIIHIPEQSTGGSVSSISSPQSGAIPIQIILPNDSQQAIPLVSQLLNSIINRGTSDAIDGRTVGQTSTIGQISSKEITEGAQNFVVQIPAPSGTVKDPTGVGAESQSFLLQIPGNENFN